MTQQYAVSHPMIWRQIVSEPHCEPLEPPQIIRGVVHEVLDQAIDQPGDGRLEGLSRQKPQTAEGPGLPVVSMTQFISVRVGIWMNVSGFICT